MIKPIYVSPSLRETSLLTLSQFLKVSHGFDTVMEGKSMEDYREGDSVGLFDEKMN